MNPFPPVEDFFRLGRSLKSHGTNGQLRLGIENSLKNYVQKDAYLFFMLNGSRVPFKVNFVEDGAHFVVALDTITDKSLSDVLAGLEIWIPLHSVRPQHLKSPKNIRDKWDQFVIIAQDSGHHFPILRVEEFPQQLMAIISFEGKEVLIPLSEQLITSIDRKKREIYMQIPEGLLEL